jgi:hypothetical protein
MQALFALGCNLVAACVVAAAVSAAESPKLRGDSYYFSMGQMYDLHAFQHARMLHKFTSAHEKVPVEILKEHVAAIRANIAAAEKSFSRLSDAAKANPSMAAKLAEIRAYNEKIMKLCDQVEQSARDEKLESQALQQQAAEIKQHLTASYRSSQSAASAANLFTEQWDEPGHGVFSD